MTLRRRMRDCIAGIAALALLPQSALAQAASVMRDAFPGRPITLIVPFPAGGPSDALARAVAQGMSIPLQQPIVVENISGASGAIGLTKLARSAPDGYTYGFGTVGTHVANAALYKKLPYDPLADFEPIGLAGTAPTMLVARPSLPASNLPDFVAYAVANRAKATYGSAGVGSISHFACVILLSALKQNITHVPYRGVAPAINDLMGGHIDVMCDQSTTALPQVTRRQDQGARRPHRSEIGAAAGRRDRRELRIRRREHPLMECVVRAQGHACADRRAAQRCASRRRCRRRPATADAGSRGRPAGPRPPDAARGNGVDRARTRARCSCAAGARGISRLKEAACIHRIFPLPPRSSTKPA